MKKENSNRAVNVCTSGIELPQGQFCGNNCSDGCRYWDAFDRNDRGETYCMYYNTYYRPRDRQGCLSFVR